MKIELNAKTAKTFVKALEKLNEESLIIFDKEGIKTRIMDNSHTHILDIRIPKESTELYNFGGATATEVGVVVERIKDMTKTLTVKDTLEIEYNLNNSTWLQLSANGVERKVRLLNATHMKRLEVPPTEHKWSAKLPMKEMKAFLTSLGKTLHFDVLVDETVSFVATTDDGEVRLDFDTSVIDLHTESGSYETTLTTAHFLTLIAATSAKCEFMIKGGNDTVIETTWNEAHINIRGWIAPRSSK